MKEVFANKILEKEFQEKGYVKVPFLNNDEISYVLSEFKKLHPDSDFEIPENSYDISFYGTIWDTNIENRQKSADLIREVFSSAINRLDLDYQIVLPTFFVKPPNKGKIDPHHDIFLSSNLNDRTINIWCPLVDTDDYNGTLQVVEGSHKVMPNIPNLNAPYFYFDDFFNAIFEEYSKSIPVNKGESVIFDTNLIHWSPNNKSNSVRYSAQAICIPKKSTPVFYYKDAESSTEDLELLKITEVFFIENTMPKLMSGKIKGADSVGVVKHINRKISEKEFVKFLKSGREIKPDTMIDEKSLNQNKNFSFMGIVKSKLGIKK